MSNASTFAESIKKVGELQRKQLMPLMVKLAERMVLDAISMREGWVGFTGNLPTSYAAAVYDFDGKIYGNIILIGDLNPNFSEGRVVREKLQRGERAYLENPFEGRARRREGMVDIADPHGASLSRSFLQSYKPKEYPAIVVCTGAEYSRYLEEKNGYNVLSNSADSGYVERVGDYIFASAEYAARSFSV